MINLPFLVAQTKISWPCALLQMRTAENSSFVGHFRIGWLVLSQRHAASVVFCMCVPRMKPEGEAWSVLGLTKNLSDLNVSSGASVYVSQTQTYAFSLELDTIKLSLNLRSSVSKTALFIACLSAET